MPDTEKVEGAPGDAWSKVDFVRILPILGIVYAFMFDIGYFWGIDVRYFSFFSISEHVLFALSAAPFAFGLLLLFLAVYVLASALYRLDPQTFSNAALRILMVCTPALLVAIYFGYTRGFDRSLAMLFIILIDVFFETVIPESDKFRNLPVVIGILLLIVAFDLGLTASQNMLLADTAGHTITLKTGGEAHFEFRNVSILRTGERGVLFYEPEAKSINFINAGDIEEVKSKTDRRGVLKKFYELFK